MGIEPYEGFLVIVTEISTVSAYAHRSTRMYVYVRL
jgi:hypothetical protein